MHSLTTLLISLVTLACTVHALDNGVGRLPVMGYTSYHLRCNTTQDQMRMDAERMISLGLKDVGYNYVNFDSCYAESDRSADGQIVADRTRFPLGMPVLTAEIHGLGMKAGVYGSYGWGFCSSDTEPGSFQNELKDVRHWQLDWGFDYLKLVGCKTPYDDVTRQGVVGMFQRTTDAVAQVAQESGRDPLVLNLGIPQQQPYLWASRLAQSWRAEANVVPAWSSIAATIHELSFISWSADFYAHNDLDYLQIGLAGLTFEEAKTHFTAWALLKSPLIINTDLSQISDQNLAIFKNEEIIAINQDPLVGRAVTPFRWGANPDWTNDPARPAQYWSGETQNGTVFMLINVLNTPATLTFNLTESPWIRAGRQYAVRDLWAHADSGIAVRSYTARAVPAHGVVALLLQDAGDEPEGLAPPCAFPNADCTPTPST
ncbi:glycoside hydrolase [Daedaleopsis nitida]|nr:glycoside hydrolase [Daedaleopsis nitida]